MNALTDKLNLDMMTVRGAQTANTNINLPPFEMRIGSTGRLFEKDGQLHFDGDYHESAAVLMDYVCSIFNHEITALRKEAARAQANEREACRQMASMRGA